MGNNSSSIKEQEQNQIQQVQQVQQVQQAQQAQQVQQQVAQPPQFQQNINQGRKQSKRSNQKLSQRSFIPMPNQPDVFNDDEPINEQQQQQQLQDMNVKPQNQKIDLEKSIQFDLKSITKAIKLNSKESQTIPTMVSLDCQQVNDKQPDLNSRPAIDLICVIDKSGSMSGQKMQQVQETLTYLLELLNENDRLSIISFANSASRLIPLIKNSKENQEKLKQTINSIYAGGGTNISSGMQLALKTIKERKYMNPVTSIFLLSDGLDYSNAVSYIEQNGNIENTTYSINTFGFGANHDPKLMNDISATKDGSFYYVENIDTVDEMFVDALGGLFSIVAQNVLIKVQLSTQNSKIFSDVSIQKTYGDMWKYDQKTNEYSINILQLISGISKEFLLELQLPPIEYQLQDFERNTVLLTAEISLFANDDKEQNKPIKKQSELELTFYNENEEIPQEIGEVNDAVEINYMRVRGAETMQNVLAFADKGEYEQGQKLIKQVQQDMDTKVRPENRKKLQMLYQDLDDTYQNCNKTQYQTVGKFNTIQNSRAHMEKKSRNRKAQTSSRPQMSNIQEEQFDMYQNQTQQMMVQERVMSKQSKF